MMKAAALAVLVTLTLVQQPAPQAPSGKSGDAARATLARLIEQGKGPYTKVADGVWTTPYRGKNMQTLTIRVGAAEDGVFFFVHLFDRKAITLSRNMLLKIAELNATFDYGKIALDDDELQVRVDARAKLLDLAEFLALEAQAAAVADEAYGVLKDFVQ